jgi:hypothetical protein
MPVNGTSLRNINNCCNAKITFYHRNLNKMSMPFTQRLTVELLIAHLHIRFRIKLGPLGEHNYFVLLVNGTAHLKKM